MRKFLRDVKISTRVSVLVILSLLLMSVVLEFGLRQIDAIGKEIKVITEETVPLLESLNQIAICHSRQGVYFEQAIRFGKYMTRDEAAKEDFRTAKQAFSSLGKTVYQEIEKGRKLIGRIYEKYQTVERGRVILKVDYEWRGISKEYSDYGFLCEQILSLVSQGKFKEAETAMERLEEQAGGVDEVLGAVALKTTNFVTDSIARTEKRKLNIMAYMLSFSGIVLLFSLGVGISISRGISKLLGAAVNIANRITAGDRDVKIKATTKDETGTLLAAMEKMSDSAQQAESELSRKRNLLCALVDTLPDQIFAKDTNGVFVFNNLSCARNLGAQTPKAVVGKTDFDFLPATEAEGYYATEQEIVRTGQPLINHEVRLHNGTDGTTKWSSTTKVPWRDKNGNIIGIVGLASDITERKQAEDNLRTTYKKLEKSNQELKETQSQLVQSEKLASIGQLAAGVAHEMNTPVGFVASNFQTLESYVAKFKGLIEMYRELLGQIETLEKSELKQKANDIERTSNDMKISFILKDIQALFDESREGLNRVTTVIQNLKDFSRVDQSEEFDEYDLNSGINATLVVARNEIKYDADLKTDLGDLPSVPCNPGQINQVFLNILINAAQAIKSQERKDKGTITIRTYATETQALCEISDDGPGIRPENLSKIFDPFFTTKPSGKGTGLGLSVSYDLIANKHKGELLVDSTPGRGSTFIIKLPIKKPKQYAGKETDYNGAKNRIIC